MSSGFSDFGASNPNSITQKVIDLGEVANRILYGFGSSYRSGEWLWASGFENGLAEFDGTTGTVAIESSNHVYSGAQSAKFTTAATLNAEAAIKKKFGSLSNQIGLEYAFKTLTLTVAAEYRWIIIKDADALFGEQPYQGIIKIVVAPGSYDQQKTLEVYDYNGGAPAYVPVASIGLHDSQYHIGKLVVDFNTGKYVRFILGKQVFDLSAYSLDRQANMANGHGVVQYASMSLRTIAAVAKDAYIDNFIITQNEFIE